MIKPNVGKVDRVVRAIAGIIIVLLGLFFLDSAAKIIAIIFGSMILLTGVFGYCGLYTLLGVNTCKRQ